MSLQTVHRTLIDNDSHIMATRLTISAPRENTEHQQTDMVDSTPPPLLLSGLLAQPQQVARFQTFQDKNPSSPPGLLAQSQQVARG